MIRHFNSLDKRLVYSYILFMPLAFSLREAPSQKHSLFRNEKVGNRLCFLANPLLCNKLPNIACVLSHQWERATKHKLRNGDGTHPTYVFCTADIPTRH